MNIIKKIESKNIFKNNLNNNYSVLATAGSGKTLAIVDRVTNYILNKIDQKNSFLVIVTYTEKAATEMKKRVIKNLLYKGTNLLNLNDIFFGTIHSFCLKLIDQYKNDINIFSNFTILENKEKELFLWNDFTTNNTQFFNIIKKPIYKNLFKFINLEMLISLSKKLPYNIINNYYRIDDCFPKLNFNKFLSYKPNKFIKSFEKNKLLVIDFIFKLKENIYPLSLPDLTKGSSEFKRECISLFKPLLKWIEKSLLKCSIEVLKTYQKFKINKGYLNYDDILYLSNNLIKKKNIKEKLYTKYYSIILDEAQDTDKFQFDTLLRLVNSSFKSKLPIQEGRFSMVGDPNQCIYSTRVNINDYLMLHKKINKKVEINFSITHRCSEKIINFVNNFFNNTLKDNFFIKLKKNDESEIGNLCKYVIKKNNIINNINDATYFESFLLAKNIPDIINKFKITNLSKIAILNPRKDNLIYIAKALDFYKIPYNTDINLIETYDSPAYKWFIAIISIMANPCDSFEINGILREFYCFSDLSIAIFCQDNMYNNDIHPLNILTRENKSVCKISKILFFLYSIREKIILMPLRNGINYLIEKIELKERLLKLPKYNNYYLLKELEIMLVEVSFFEKKNYSILELFNYLKDKMINKISIKKIDNNKNGIQLLTSHKSKGLEWDTVIIPFFFKPINYPIDKYPQLFSYFTKCKNLNKVFINSYDVKKIYEKKMLQIYKNEIKKLLYVTITRAKKNIFFIDDENIFEKNNNSMSSTINCLKKQKNRKKWNDLENYFFNKSFDQDELNIDDNNHNKKALYKEKFFIPEKIKNRINKFLKPISAKSNLEQNEDNKNLYYGKWWHLLMKNFPWNKNNIIQNVYFKKMIRLCPIKEKGKNEFIKFINSNFYKYYTKKNYIFQTETPFIYKDRNQLYEGFIDLICIDNNKNISIIVDWKTDSDASYEKLYNRYKSQLYIYYMSLKKITNNEVKVCIYSTMLSDLYYYKL